MFLGLHNIPSNARWSVEAEVHLDGLRSPFGLVTDQRTDSIYISEADENHVISYTSDENKTREILTNLRHPTDVLIDTEKNSLIIADYHNRRVITSSLQMNKNQTETLIEKIYCWGLTMDDEGALYVTDPVKHEVRRYPKGDKIGIVVAGGNGQGSSLTQLNFPTSVAVDSEHSVYVSEFNNRRVVKFILDSKQAIVVVDNLDRLMKIFVDADDNLYITETNNHRIVRYRKNIQAPEILIDSTQLQLPVAISFDRHNNLYVTDSGRLLRFLIVS